MFHGNFVAGGVLNVGESRLWPKAEVSASHY